MIWTGQTTAKHLLKYLTITGIPHFKLCVQYNLMLNLLKFICGCIVGPYEQVTIWTSRCQNAMAFFVLYRWELIGWIFKIKKNKHNKLVTCRVVMMPWWPVNMATGAAVWAHHTLIVYNQITNRYVPLKFI